MGILSDFFIAEEENFQAYNGLDDFPKEDLYQAKRLSPLELAALLGVLTGEGDRLGLMDEFTLLTEEDAESWTYATPARFAEALLSIHDPDLGSISEKLANVRKEELAWPPSEFVPLLKNLKKLCERAKDKHKRLFFWVSL